VTTTPTTTPNRKELEERSVGWVLVSYVQDLILTNMHWFYTFWILLTTVGLNVFSWRPWENLFRTTVGEATKNTLVVMLVWILYAKMIPFAPKRKVYRFNVFGLINDRFVRFLSHRKGLFHDSVLKHEETIENYRERSSVFAIVPHGTLPTSVLPVWDQFPQLFSEVCMFFGFQVTVVPGYRYILAMRGGFMPITKQQLVGVMETGQSVSLVPGGVQEMLHCEAHDQNINVCIRHKGFCRLALQHGYDLVPTFFFHANDQYDNPLKVWQEWTYKRTRIPIGLPWYTNKWGWPCSNRVPIRVAVGKHVRVERNPSPTPEDVDRIHKLFYEEVHRIFEKYKHELGYGDRTLTYVC